MILLLLCVLGAQAQAHNLQRTSGHFMKHGGSVLFHCEVSVEGVTQLQVIRQHRIQLVVLYYKLVYNMPTSRPTQCHIIWEQLCNSRARPQTGHVVNAGEQHGNSIHASNTPARTRWPEPCKNGRHSSSASLGFELKTTSFRGRQRKPLDHSGIEGTRQGEEKAKRIQGQNNQSLRR